MLSTNKSTGIQSKTNEDDDEFIPSSKETYFNPTQIFGTNSDDNLITRSAC